MKNVEITEALFEGTISFDRGDGWLQPVRLEIDKMPLYHEQFAIRAEMAGGCRLRFATTSRNVALEIVPQDDEGARKFDLTLGADLLATVAVEPGETEARFENLPEGEKTLELWFPTHRTVQVRQLLVDADADATVVPDDRPKWITYGSSITHCGAAHSPARTWPATVARLRGLNMTSLGYGGQCHMDPLVAMMIRDQKADFISLKVGINMVGGSVSERTFRTGLIGMVQIIREKHPATPIAVVSPIISPPREETPGSTGMTLQLMRNELEIAVARLRECGDENVSYFDGLDLFGEDLVADYLPDELHPNGDGYEIMGRNFAEKVFDKMVL